MNCYAIACGWFVLYGAACGFLVGVLLADGVHKVWNEKRKGMKR